MIRFLRLFLIASFPILTFPVLADPPNDDAEAQAQTDDKIAADHNSDIFWNEQEGQVEELHSEETLDHEALAKMFGRCPGKFVNRPLL